jgi:hypothetical protein
MRKTCTDTDKIMTEREFWFSMTPFIVVLVLAWAIIISNAIFGKPKK